MEMLLGVRPSVTTKRVAVNRLLSSSQGAIWPQPQPPSSNREAIWPQPLSSSQGAIWPQLPSSSQGAMSLRLPASSRAAIWLQLLSLSTRWVGPRIIEQVMLVMRPAGGLVLDRLLFILGWPRQSLRGGMPA